ncbi:MAG TPA: hypothetical protein VGP26_17250 [Actinophytocola sp.]|nr:hypothetical protein [Actinophytocola sp.]
MGLSRAASNTELHEMAGIRIDGRVRRDLNEQQLVVSTRANGRAPFVHELTDKGWRRCEDLLTAELDGRATSLGKALHVVLAGLDRYRQRKNLRLADIFQPPAEITRDELEPHIRAAYAKLAREQYDWVRLADLRGLLDGASREDVDGAFLEMSRNRKAQFSSASNNKALTDADRAAAVEIGGEKNHLIAIETS